MDADLDRYDAPPAGRRSRNGVSYPNVAVAKVRGYRPLHLDLRVPAGDRPVPLVIWVHGGAWWAGSRVALPEPIAAAGFHRRLLRRGYAVAGVDYRLSREATFPAPLNDVKAAIRWLRAYAGELGLDPGRFAAWGESAGGHLAALAGLTGEPTTLPALEGDIGVVGVSSAVAAVVDWYGPADLLNGWDDLTGPVLERPDEWLLGGSLRERLPEAIAASPVGHAHPGAPPFRLVHGTADTVVPYRQSELLAGALRGQGIRCDLVPVPGAGHVFVGAEEQIGAIVESGVDFLDEVFSRSSTAPRG